MQTILQKERPVKYWNDGFSGITYDAINTPSTNTYGSVEALRNNYGTANFDSNSVYIKTTTEHQACLYYNNKEFYLSSNYWVDGDADKTKAKLKTDIESTLGVIIADDNCHFSSSNAGCGGIISASPSIRMDIFIAPMAKESACEK